MEWIKNIVNDLVKTYDTRDVYELIKYLNIVLTKKDLPHPVKGLFFKDNFANEYIFVLNNLSIQEEKIVIAHEIGHSLLHNHLRTNCYIGNQLLNKRKFELQANKFAAELLISDRVDSTLEFMTISQLSCFLDVPEELVKIKFKKE